MILSQFRCVLVSACLVAFTAPLAAQPIDVDGTFDFAATRLIATSSWLPAADVYPNYTQPGGTWNTDDPTSWTSGFLAQCLWTMYERTGDELWRALAEYRQAAMEPQKYTTTHHDLGFEIYNTFGYGYRMTGNTEFRDICLTAAASFATRYNANVGALKSRDWQEPFPVMIDAMMNLELMFFSSLNGGPPEHWDMAVQHALTTRRDHIRADGGSYHGVDYNPITGEPEARPGEDDPYRTDQGWQDESTWSRGEAWGLHGFTSCYRWTGDPRFLETALLMADYWRRRVPADAIPYWDFDIPPDGEPRDSSAGAVGASALLELATIVTGADRVKYFETAETAVRSLSGPNYLAEGTPHMSIVLHGTYHKPAGRGVDTGLIWSDAYFLEALMRYEAFMASLRPGDADLDGDVDLDDFVILKQNFNTGARRTRGDFDDDGDVDLDDFVILKQNFGR